ncbi:hypothetical protein RUM44_009783 [Polyplax serrata]|uniref:Uncharacterized protein n=1 Tax=Polyplax serrata TaxID=468196 RepID=A0ABR1AU97_POLSC
MGDLLGLAHPFYLNCQVLQNAQTRVGLHKEVLTSSVTILLLFQLSPSAKVFRWFKLAPSNAHPLSRPESGFVDGDKSQKDGDEDCFKVDGIAYDEEGILEGSQSLLESLGSRKRKKLLKLQLGRMTTF